MLKVGIIDSDKKSVKDLKNIIARSNDMRLVFSTNSGKQGLNYIKTIQSDVIVMDLCLEDLDGLSLLEELSQEKGLSLPKIIIVSNIKQEDSITEAINYGAAYYMFKPINYSLLIRRIQGFGHFKDSYMDADHRKIENAIFMDALKTNEMEISIGNYLAQLGISPSLSGYRYLKDAIRLVISDSSYLNKMTKGLYETVAILNNTTWTRVERNMRFAINNAYQMCSRDQVELTTWNYIVGRRPRPTNMDFICFACENFKRSNKGRFVLEK
ncbi:MAG: response regulator [Clostridia bacterium]|nr:response regulator [Clostridia bacterium]